MNLILLKSFPRTNNLFFVENARCRMKNAITILQLNANVVTNVIHSQI